MHPSSIFNYTLPNATVKAFIKYLLLIHQENKVVKSKEQMCIVFHHLQFENRDIKYMKHCQKVKQQGPSDNFYQEEGTYTAPNPVKNKQNKRQREEPPPDKREIEKGVSCSWDQAEDIS